MGTSTAAAASLGDDPDQPQRQRGDDRRSGPRAGARAVISTPSRTPRPPGITATTNPATVASATRGGDRPARARRGHAAPRLHRPDHRELAQAQQDPAERRPEQPLAQQPARETAAAPPARRPGIGRLISPASRRNTGGDDHHQERQAQPQAETPPGGTAAARRPQPGRVNATRPESPAIANPAAATRPPAAIMTRVS